jgi:glycosyltransferase involved in cell wall biosynthesis
LLHAGSLYGARNPAPLLRSLRNAIARGAIEPARVRLRFVGRVGVTGLHAAVGDLGLEQVVEFASHVPRRVILQEMLDASALLVVQPVTTVSVPAKLYEYMGAGRPVLALAEPGGETAEIIRRYNAGIAVHTEDEGAIERALIALMTGGDSFAPVNRAAYDGALRAADIGRILADLAGRTSMPTMARERVTRRGNTTPREATRA